VQLKASDIDHLYKEVSTRETPGMHDFKGGKIIVADDICTHIEIVKSKMKKMGMDEYAEYYTNGQQVIDRVK
jgi:hypothetical protein